GRTRPSIADRPQLVSLAGGRLWKVRDEQKAAAPVVPDDAARRLRARPQPPEHDDASRRVTQEAEHGLRDRHAVAQRTLLAMEVCTDRGGLPGHRADARFVAGGDEPRA